MYVVFYEVGEEDARLAFAYCETINDAREMALGWVDQGVLNVRIAKLTHAVESKATLKSLQSRNRKRKK